MEENKEFIQDGEQKALVIARLLQLIDMNTKTIQRHQDSDSPLSIIEQYQDLRQRYLNELAEVMQGYGVGIRLMALDRAA